MKTVHIEVNTDEKCKICGKGGAVKQENGEYGICFECAGKRIGGYFMKQTREQIISELETLFENYWEDIKTAYQKGAGVTVSAKVIIEPEGQEIAITPTIEFYPLPKTKSEKYTVRLNEKQLGIAGMQ